MRQVRVPFLVPLSFGIAKLLTLSLTLERARVCVAVRLKATASDLLKHELLVKSEIVSHVLRPELEIATPGEVPLQVQEVCITDSVHGIDVAIHRLPQPRLPRDAKGLPQ